MSLLAHQLELLSPARDVEIGIEAINHGADAVYIGGPGFGARASAGNSVQDIERLCRHAHKFNSRIFIALNTILRDDELEGAGQMAWDVYHAGADVLIVQDMGLLQMDLPPMQLHASTQTDIRTVEKARFLADVGFSQIVLARELTLETIQDIHQAIDPERCQIEFFVHGALCVAYSGQCFISHAHTGRSANRGECSQACRLPYEVVDAQGRIVAHQKHVLSMKDNNQSQNLAALVDAGVRSFKIEGRYKDMAYVKNITAHYRLLLDELIEAREHSAQPFARASSGRTRFTFQPDPNQNFNREFTDYFVNGRIADLANDIGAFDSPKNPGQAIGWVSKTGANFLELELQDPSAVLHNGDGLCYHTLHKELVGVAINRAERIKGQLWRVFPKDPMEGFKDLRKGVEINRNRDMDWVRGLEKKSSDRRIGLWAQLECDALGVQFTLTDEDGNAGVGSMAGQSALAQDDAKALQVLRDSLGRFGNTDFVVNSLSLSGAQGRSWPASQMNELRREAHAALVQARERACTDARPQRAAAVEPPVAYPQDSLTYLANVFNQKAHDFYALHGVKVIGAAYESGQEEGEVSLMITKHCVRWSMSLCPKQAKGVTGVQGTVKAEPMQLINGKEKLTLRFDCKPCEMHVVGKVKPGVQHEQKRELTESRKAAFSDPDAVPIRFYKVRPSKSSA